MALILALLEHQEQHAEVRDCLERAGYEVVVVDSFLRAKPLLQKLAFDLIVSDVHLENGGSVFDFLKWVKDDRALRTIPFVLLSVRPSKLAKYLADGVRTAARTFGAAKYIDMETFDAAVFASEIAELSSLDETVVKQAALEDGK